ncbi:MAG: ubiG 2 [Phycisphaerales bacterium]|nr:ubiG 2 [Phycisphaerales bacterium]
MSKDVLVRLQSAAIQEARERLEKCVAGFLISVYSFARRLTVQTQQLTITDRPASTEGRAGFDPLSNLEQMASLIGEVSGEPVGRVIERLEYERVHPGRTVADDFAKAGGPRYEWGPHLEKFYGSTDAFLYELAVWNRNGIKRQLRRWVTRHMARQQRPLDVLSVGDGLGFDCLHLARKQHRVTYFELPGLGERFARKLFERTGRDIPMLTDPARIPLESFDAVTCFDVLEHVPDPPAMVRALASYLRPGGLLYVSAPFFMILPWYPTHLRSNRKFSGCLSLYRQAGLRLADGRFSWLPIVLQKPLPGAPPAQSMGTFFTRLTAPFQMVGRATAWPFFPGHVLRRLCDRPFADSRAGKFQ